MGRGWVVNFTKTIFIFFLFSNLLNSQITPKPILEKYGDSLSVFIFKDNDLVKASKFIEKIDNKIKGKPKDGLAVYYYYKSIYLKKIGNDEYKKLFRKTLRELNKSENYFIYKILVNEQLSRISKSAKNFEKELIYLSAAFDLLKKK